MKELSIIKQRKITKKTLPIKQMIKTNQTWTEKTGNLEKGLVMPKKYLTLN